MAADGSVLHEVSAALLVLTRTATSPSIFSISPSRAEIREDLPQPTWPTTATREPWGTSMLMLGHTEGRSHPAGADDLTKATHNKYICLCTMQCGLLCSRRECCALCGCCLELRTYLWRAGGSCLVQVNLPLMTVTECSLKAEWKEGQMNGVNEKIDDW